ncbi:melatonin receptor type 1B-B-like [Ptychodera flava]|uniref:melatonin receptor type 1B-B-like n=1 Tax=Ptychodera flava TaxID=63121 RepID=UPI003969FE04
MNRTNSTVVDEHNADNAMPADDLPPSWLTYLCGTLELLLAVGAIVGNAMFILIVAFKKKLRSWMNVFLVNLSITDIIAALFVSLPTTDAYYHRSWRFGATFCLIHNLLHPILVATSLWLTACISMNRYIYIVHNKRYQQLTNKFTMTIAITFVWVAPVLAQYRIYMDASLSSYAPSAFRCRKPEFNFFFILFIYIPTAMVCVLYVPIIAFVINSRRRLRTHAAAEPHITTVRTGPTPQEVRMALVIFGVFCLVLLGYLPFAVIVNIYQLFGRRPPVEALLGAYPLQHIGGVLNPCLYGVNNRQFKDAYMELLTGKLIRCSIRLPANAVTPLTTRMEVGTSDNNLGLPSTSMDTSLETDRVL